MQNRTLIGTSEAVVLLTTFISTKIFLSYQVGLYHAAANAAWISPLIYTVAGIACTLLLVSLLKRFPDKNVIEIGEELVGPCFNTFFSLIYTAFFLSVAGLSVRQFAEYALTGFLPDTPISLLIISFLLGITFVNFLGIEVLARVARVLALPIALSLLAFTTLTIHLWQPHALFPIWGSGPVEIMRGAATHAGVMSEIFLLAFLSPYFPSKKLTLIGVWSIVAAGLLLTVFTLLPLVVFTYPTVTELSLPSLEIARIITLGRFGQRLETLFLPIWAFSGMINVAAGLCAAAKGTASLLQLKDFKPFILPMAVLSLCISFLPLNISQAAIWDHEILDKYSLPILSTIIVILLARAAVRSRGGKKDGRIH